jgi:phage shock protein PspC (stress-responsive transcriptional regulator)
MLAGVCSGLAEYLEIDVVLIRVAFIVAFLAGLSGGLAYIIFWVVMPVKRHYYSDGGRFNVDYRVHQEQHYRTRS